MKRTELIANLRTIINGWESLDKEDFIFDKLMGYVPDEVLHSWLYEMMVKAIVVDDRGILTKEIALLQWSKEEIKKMYPEMEINMYSHFGTQIAVLHTKKLSCRQAYHSHSTALNCSTFMERA